MRIAFISQPGWSPDDACGDAVSIWTQQVARRLASQGEVVIYATAKGRRKAVFKRDGIEFRLVPLSENWPGYDRLCDLGDRIGLKPIAIASAYYRMGYALRIAKDLRSLGPDVVHIQSFSNFVPIIRWLNPSPLIALHMHCDWLTGMDRAAVLRRLTKANLVLSCSDYVTNRTRQGFPEVASRCQTVPNGVDTDVFSPGPGQRGPDGEKRILFVGRLSPEKGPHTLIEAFGLVRERLKNVRLQLVGRRSNLSCDTLRGFGTCDNMAQLEAFCSENCSQPYFQYLISRTGELGLTPKCEFHEAVPHVQLVDFYRQADVVVNSSFIEAFGMTVAEAMSCGLPVVASRAGGLPDIVEDGKTGLLFEPGNASSLAGAIVTMLESDSMRKSMGESGRKRILERFSWEHVADALLCRYAEAKVARCAPVFVGIQATCPATRP